MRRFPARARIGAGECRAAATPAWRGIDPGFFVEPNRQQLCDIAAMLDAGQLQPIISAVVPFDQAAVAYAREPLRNRRPGKTVVTLIPPG
jgi:NADPH:quinone reductase-like Zn-dependent oxidoreductase